MLLLINQTVDIDSIQLNFDTKTQWVLNIAIGIVMLGVALGITLDDFKRLFKNPKILFVGILSQFILLPAITFLVILIINPHPSFALGLMLVAACPGGNISNFYSKLAKGNAALSVSLTAFATLACLIMTPLNLQFWGSIYEPTYQILKTVELDWIELVKVVLLIIGFPLAMGMYINHQNKNLAIKLEKIIKPFSMLVFLSLVFFAILKNSENFLKYTYLVAYLVIGHNILAFVIGYFTGKSFKLNHQDTKTITMETGIQNAGLGLLIIFTFFEDLGGMAILTAFWAIWDILSGMLLALYWERKAKKRLSGNFE